MKISPRVSILRTVLRTTIVLCPLLFMLLSGCGKSAVSPPATGTPHCGGRTCEGNGDCKVNVPMCAKSTTAVCTPPPKVCAWQLNTSDVKCRCIEGDVRLCMAGSTPGVETCIRNSTNDGTIWDGCIPCPTCTQG